MRILLQVFPWEWRLWPYRVPRPCNASMWEKRVMWWWWWRDDSPTLRGNLCRAGEQTERMKMMRTRRFFVTRRLVVLSTGEQKTIMPPVRRESVLRWQQSASNNLPKPSCSSSSASSYHHVDKNISRELLSRVLVVIKGRTSGDHVLARQELSQRLLKFYIFYVHTHSDMIH